MRGNQNNGGVEGAGGAEPAAPTPGRTTRTQALQRRSAGAPAPEPSADTPAAAGPASSGGDPFGLHLLASEGVAGGGGDLPHRDAIQASFGAEHDVSGVRAHVGGAAAQAATAIDAEAYAMDGQVAFARGPDLHTAAHEAAHVVQQRGGLQLLGGMGQDGDVHEQHADAVADRVVAGQSARDLLAPYSGGGGGAGVVQRRRLPGNAGDLLENAGDHTQPGANFAASSEGMKRLIARAIRELTPANVTSLTTTLGADWQTRVAASTDPQFITQVSDAIRAARPDLTLGDPALINVAPTSGSTDETNLNTLMGAADAIFDAIAGGGNDTDLEQVFGTANVGTAKGKYAQGKTWMHNLATQHKIVTDRSGYAGEVGLGGLTSYHTRMSLSPGIFDNPSAPASVVTMIHESMHAGNSDVHDYGYIHQPSFTQLAESVKLTNAAHFEVVPRRILATTYAFTGQTFTPAGATVGGVTAPALTDSQQAIRDTSEAFRLAWTSGLRLHGLFLNAYNEPTGWTTDRGGGKRWSTGLPYWSHVVKATVHAKTDIDPTSSDPARRPVSQIDMALIEGLTHRLVAAMRTVPRDETALTTLEDANLTVAERTAARASVAARKDCMIKLVLRGATVGELTGTPERDFRVIGALSTLTWSTVLDVRDISSFPD